MRLWDCILVFFHPENKANLMNFLFYVALGIVKCTQQQLLTADLNTCMTVL